MNLGPRLSRRHRRTHARLTRNLPATSDSVRSIPVILFLLIDDSGAILSVAERRGISLSRPRLTVGRTRLTLVDAGRGSLKSLLETAFGRLEPVKGVQQLELSITQLFRMRSKLLGVFDRELYAVDRDAHLIRHLKLNWRGPCVGLGFEHLENFLYHF